MSKSIEKVIRTNNFKNSPNNITDKTSFFMANRSEYNSKLHKSYNKYLSEKEYLNV